MEHFLKFAEIIGIVGIWIIVFWISKLIITLKSGIDSQKGIIDSFKAQSDYINSLQSTVSKLYDPQEIDKVVAIKVEQEISKERSKFKNATLSTLKSFQAMLSYIATSTIYMNDSAIEEALKTVSKKHNEEFVINFVRETRQEVLKVRNKAIAKLKT